MPSLTRSKKGEEIPKIATFAEGYFWEKNAKQEVLSTQAGDVTKSSVSSHSEASSSSDDSLPVTDIATFGMGCFWANDALFGAQQGVLSTRVGYAGGTTESPVYKDMGDHTEVVEVIFDPKITTYNELLRLFWDNHEYGLTTVIKKQYRSVILYHDEKQRQIAEKDIEVEAGKRNEKLTTEIEPAGEFYPAEDYHQKYRLQKHPEIVKALKLTPEQLQTSLVAARLNGYIAGVGKRADFYDDLVLLGIPEFIAAIVKDQFNENEGGTLYC